MDPVGASRCRDCKLNKVVSRQHTGYRLAGLLCQSPRSFSNGSYYARDFRVIVAVGDCLESGSAQVLLWIRNLVPGETPEIQSGCFERDFLMLSPPLCDDYCDDDVGWNDVPAIARLVIDSYWPVSRGLI